MFMLDRTRGSMDRGGITQGLMYRWMLESTHLPYRGSERIFQGSRQSQRVRCCAVYALFRQTFFFVIV